MPLLVRSDHYSWALESRLPTTYYTAYDVPAPGGVMRVAEARRTRRVVAHLVRVRVRARARVRVRVRVRPYPPRGRAPCSGASASAHC